MKLSTQKNTWRILNAQETSVIKGGGGKDNDNGNQNQNGNGNGGIGGTPPPVVQGCDPFGGGIIIP